MVQVCVSGFVRGNIADWKKVRPVRVNYSRAPTALEIRCNVYSLQEKMGRGAGRVLVDVCMYVCAKGSLLTHSKSACQVRGRLEPQYAKSGSDSGWLLGAGGW